MSFRDSDIAIYNEASRIRETTVNDAIDILVNDYHDDIGVNWSENDGGYRKLTLYIYEGNVTMNMNIRWSKSQTAYFRELDVETGEQLN
ncbi:MAG: hypothetical protein P8179_10720 [Candidatus Thiodiazotropha sp.]